MRPMERCPARASPQRDHDADDEDEDPGLLERHGEGDDDEEERDDGKREKGRGWRTPAPRPARRCSVSAGPLWPGSRSCPIDAVSKTGVTAAGAEPPNRYPLPSPATPPRTPARLQS